MFNVYASYKVEINQVEKQNIKKEKETKAKSREFQITTRNATSQHKTKSNTSGGSGGGMKVYNSGLGMYVSSY
jgi:hypothetical protein